MIDDAPFHVGLTPERIVAEAVALTRETHLMGWSVRDLARRLDVAASVLYHHVGGKDVIVRRVVEHVLDQTAIPDPTLAWQDWFRAVILPSRDIIAAHPGVAQWLLLHGPSLTLLEPSVEAGVATLQRAGFGDRAALAYAALLNNTLSAVAMGDERRLIAGDEPEDHAAMLADLQTSDSEAIALIGATLVEPFIGDAQAVRAADAAYFSFILETTIAGLETLLDPEP
ncbi:TetR/AcrR family transcriptional regulator [Agrococcus jejuensis]|uniref:Regulatory protein, tetR family n=1 Tax=Agrococcus jejuensis TaxID=399736 RepID=A0A1G8AXQ6_9MICO|nr:TetR/AcrR family transcriptional regulator [Agrococcus jejuensis]SDH25634.1 regulatory protein, tetR family [Agrococcus jejuensis]